MPDIPKKKKCGYQVTMPLMGNGYQDNGNLCPPQKRDPYVALNPDFAVGIVARRRNTIAKRAVGAILRRRHIHKYVEE
jgi:hypothetical protein